MVRRAKKAVDFSWFEYCPPILTWDQIKRTLRRYHLRAPDFQQYVKEHPGARQTYNGEDGDILVGYCKESLERFMRSNLWVKHR